VKDVTAGQAENPTSPEDPNEAERRYRLLVEQVPAIIYMDAVDEYSTNIYTSPQIDEILGIPREEWVNDRALCSARTTRATGRGSPSARSTG
jgi:PAS domain-containing protein